MGQDLSHKDISDIPVFFIIGRPRSGTTLLRMLFEAHPSVIVPPESPFIINLYKKYQDVTTWNEETIREFADDIFRQRYFDKWLISKADLVNSLMELKGQRSFREMAAKVMLTYRSLYEKQDIRMIGDKNPAYSLHARRIHALFPESKMIHITRDYRDNYLSLTKVNFEVPIVPLVVYRWKFNLRLAWKLKKRMPGQFYSLRYEDLAMNPEQEFGKICNFLGIEYDPKVMAFHEKKAEAERAYANKDELAIVHRSLFNPISTGRMDLWKKEMTPREIRVADLVAGKAAEKAGYQRQYTGFNPALYLWILPTLVYGSMMYRMMLFGEKLPHAMRNALGHFLGIFLKLYWRFNKRKVKPL